MPSPLDGRAISVAQGEFTRSEKKTLRKLAEEAYARELDHALRDLDEAFSDWRRKDISGFQLSDFIHDFHEGPSRELYSDYMRLDPGFLVARAVARRILAKDEVSKPLLDALDALIEYMREMAEEQDE